MPSLSLNLKISYSTAFVISDLAGRINFFKMGEYQVPSPQRRLPVEVLSSLASKIGYTMPNVAYLLIIAY